MPKLLRKMPTAKPFNGTMTRAFAGSPTSVNPETASFCVVMVTDTPVRRAIQDPRDPAKELVVDEVILPDGVDMSRTLGMPLVDGHKTDGGIERILGKVDNVRLENGQIVGDATLASSHEHLISDIQRGFYRQGSIGYDVLEADLVERDGDVPLFRITRCLITEYSLVAVGADENSFIRAKPGTPNSPKITFRAAGKKQEKHTMTLKRGKRAKREEAAVDTDELEAMITAVEDAIADLGDDVSEELIERARGLRGKREDDEDEDKSERKRSKRADDEDEDEPKAEDERKRSKRADEDEELTEDEQDEYEDIRSIARSYGLGKLVSDMRALGSRPSEAKRALRKAISERGAVPAAAKDIEVKQPSKRAADTKLDTTAIFAARRAR